MKYYPDFTNVQVVSFMRFKLKTDPIWANTGLLKLYLLGQTPAEQRSHSSKNRNHAGFDRYRAPLLTHLACRLRQQRALTQQEQREVMVSMPFYAKQVVGLADKEKLYRALCAYYASTPFLFRDEVIHQCKT